MMQEGPHEEELAILLSSHPPVLTHTHIRPPLFTCGRCAGLWRSWPSGAALRLWRRTCPRRTPSCCPTSARSTTGRSGGTARRAARWVGAGGGRDGYGQGAAVSRYGWIGMGGAGWHSVLLAGEAALPTPETCNSTLHLTHPLAITTHPPNPKPNLRRWMWMRRRRRAADGRGPLPQHALRGAASGTRTSSQRVRLLVSHGKARLGG